MIRLIAIAGLALSIAVSAQAMTPAPIVLQPNGMITKIAAACRVGRTRVNDVCVARTTIPAYRGGRVGVLATQNNFLARLDKPLARPHGMRAAQCARRGTLN
jgi:hypothetical protein